MTEIVVVLVTVMLADRTVAPPNHTPVTTERATPPAVRKCWPVIVSDVPPVRTQSQLRSR